MTFGGCPLSITVTDVSHVPAGSLCPSIGRPCCEPAPLIENGSTVTFCDELLRRQSASVAAPAARVRQVPAKPAQATSATARPVESGPLGSADSRPASATLIQAAVIPLIAKQATYRNFCGMQLVMIRSSDVKVCDSGG